MSQCLDLPHPESRIVYPSLIVIYLSLVILLLLHPLPLTLPLLPPCHLQSPLLHPFRIPSHLTSKVRSRCPDHAAVDPILEGQSFIVK